MKFAVKFLSVLVAGGLLLSVAAPAFAGGKRCPVESELSRLDKELFGWMRK